MKKMIIKGVGTFMAKKYAADGKGVEVLTLGTLQDLRIDLNVEIEDIFGGDGIFPIDTLVKSKGIEITATDAKFDLAQIALMMGSTVSDKISGTDSDAYIWVLNETATIKSHTFGEQTTVVGFVPKFVNDLATDDGLAVRLMSSNKLLKRITVGIPQIGEYLYDSTNKIVVVNASLVDADVEFNYKRKKDVEMAALLKDEVPFPVHIVHHGSFQQKDGTYQGVETELYMCRAMGQFSINTARTTASSSQVQLKVLDPERADKRLGTIKRYSDTENV